MTAQSPLVEVDGGDGALGAVLLLGAKQAGQPIEEIAVDVEDACERGQADGVEGAVERVVAHVPGGCSVGGAGSIMRVMGCWVVAAVPAMEKDFKALGRLLRHSFSALSITSAAAPHTPLLAPASRSSHQRGVPLPCTVSIALHRCHLAEKMLVHSKHPYSTCHVLHRVFSLNAHINGPNHTTE